MSRSPKTREKAVSAVEVIEQATALLRSSPLETLALYYIGTLPFVVALIWFWADMSRSPDAAGRLAGSALLLSFLFVWMKVFHARFAMRLLAALGGHRSMPPLGRSILLQGAIQPWSLIILPIAAILTIPFGWCLAFFHNISGAGETELGSAVSRSGKLALLWPMQNQIIILLMGLLGIVIFINIAALLYFIPSMLNTLLGMEGIAARAGQFYLSSTFWFTVAVITHICIDPIVKASYAVRCHYGDSLATGADLRALLKGLGQFSAMLLIAVSVSLPLSVPVSSYATEQTPLQERQISTRELDSSIERILKDPRFSWRMPREQIEQQRRELPGFMQSAVDWCRDSMSAVGRWIEKAIKWIFEKLPGPRPVSEPSRGWGTGFSDMALPVMYLILALLLTTGAIYAWRNLRRQGQAGDAQGLEMVSIKEPDLRDESTTADELPEEQWAALARELLAKGEVRLAMRAIYLATLASLGESGLIAIARFKTNHDYERELRRFSHTMPGVTAAFSANLLFFEQIWYGMRRPEQADVERFLENHRLISNNAAT